MKRIQYKRQKTNVLSFPLGGIGTGCIGLTGNGRLIDWEIAGRPNKGSLNGFSHFAVRAEQHGRVLDARVLQGDLPPHYIGEHGRHGSGFEGFGWGPKRETMAGAPHFRDAEFTGEYPLAELALPFRPATIRIGRRNVPFAIDEGTIKLRKGVTVRPGMRLTLA